jgi:glucose-6-phosphate isomerase
MAEILFAREVLVTRDPDPVSSRVAPGRRATPSRPHVVTEPAERPFALSLALDSGRLEPYTSRIERRASEMEGAYADSAALRQLVDAGDPIVYEVEQRDVPEEAGHLVCCTTVINPGTVGDEYFMTKGHYHAVRETAEIYLCLSGNGRLLLENEDGETAVLLLERGTVAYVPPGWAHRTVNIGDDRLVFFAVYPGDAGHDYAAIERAGFAKLVVRRDGRPAVVDNPARAR